MAENVKPPATKFRLPEASVPEPEGFEPVPAPPENVGSILRRAREGFDQSVADVSASLNIRRVYLQALEDGHYDKLPGSTYAVGFLRSYADYLDLDSKDLARRFKEEIAGHQDSTQLVFPVPATESRVPGGALILVSLVLCALAYGAWNLISKPEPQVAELVPAVPDRLQGLLENEQAQANGERPASLDQGGELSANIALANGAGEAEPAASPTSAEAEASETFGLPSDETAPASTEAVAETETAEPASGAETEPSAASERPETTDAPAVAETVAPETEVAEAAVAAAVAEPAPQSVESELRSAEPVAPVPTPVTKPAARIAPLAAATLNDGNPATDDAPAVPETRPTSLTEVAAAAASAAEPASEPLPIPKPPSLDGTAAPSDSGSRSPELAALPPQEPRIYGQENSNSRITVRATQDSWIQVRSGLDDLLLTRVLQAGDTYRVPDQLGITMQTGNAGGLEILVDGRNLGPLGPVGAVRRNVSLEANRLLDGASTQR